MSNWSFCHAVQKDPESLNSAWVFLGTRVPKAALFDNLEDDASVAQFVEWLAGVTNG